MLQNKYKGIKRIQMAHTTCVILFQRIWITVWCANAGANWRSPRPQSDRRTLAYCMRTKSRRWPIWSVTTNYCGYSGADGPAAEADGTGETDWIPVPSVPSWFRETRPGCDQQQKPRSLKSGPSRPGREPDRQSGAPLKWRQSTSLLNRLKPMILILFFLGISDSVLDLGPMYATDRRQTRIIAECPQF